MHIDAAPATMVLMIGDRPMALPQLIVDAGPAAAERFLEFFAGTIDDLRVYNRALSPGEIQTDMNTPVATGTIA